MQFKLTLGNAIQRLDDGAFIPIDPANRDYRDYLAWVALGNTAIPADPAPVNARRAALLQAIQDAVNDGTLPARIKTFLSALADTV